MSIAEKLSTIAENEQKVYEAGKKAEYDAFWDSFQENGNRTNYNRGFCGTGWTDETFRPKYDIIPVGTSMAHTIFTQSNIADLKGICEGQGIVLDFSQVTTNATELFSNCTKLVSVPIIDISNVTSATYLFAFDTKLEYVERLVSQNCDFTGAFINCTNLVHIIFDGVIGKNGIELQASKKLDKESIESLINCLSTTTSGLTVTLSLTAVKKAFETSEGANDGDTSAEWLALRSTRSNWEIVLS